MSDGLCSSMDRGVRHSAGQAYEISKSNGFLDSEWISGFRAWISGFRVDFWISLGFLDFAVDFWIWRWISRFLTGFLDF